LIVGAFLALFVALGVIGAIVGPPKKASPASAAVAPRRKAAGKGHTTRRRSLVVRKKALPAKHTVVPSSSQVRVSAVGFSQEDNDIDYGITLVNRGTADAARIIVTVRALDTLGRSAVTDQDLVSFIPAGGAFRVAGFMTPNVALKVSKLRVAVHAYTVKRTAGRLPVVSGVSFSHNDFGDITVQGTLSNPSTRPLSSYAPIYVLFLDRNDRIIDAATDTTGASVQPRASVPFHMDAIVSDATRPVAAMVSVDACTYVTCTSTGYTMRYAVTR
jgi:hypothetical protein